MDKHTCCYTPSAFDPATEATTQLECIDETLDSDCPSSGEVSTWNGFKYKRASDDSWVNWAGQDYACVDYSPGSGRGKWLDDRSADGGFNISFSGSLTNHC